MENTIRKIIYSIRERLNIYSDDSKVSDEYIMYEVDSARNAILKNYLSNLKKPIPLQALSNICLEMQEDQDCYDGIEGTVLKSKFKIPPTLEATGRSNIHKMLMENKFVKNLNLVDFERIPYLANGEFNHNQIYGTVDQEGYFILYNRGNKIVFVENVTLSIVAEYPEQAWKLRCNCNPEDVCNDGFQNSTSDNDSDCDYLDSKYPIPGEIESTIRDMVTNTILTKFRMPIDTDNNDNDNTLPDNLIIPRGRTNQG